MLKKLVIASHNSGKLKEIRDMLSPLSIEVVSAGELGIDEPEETGVTFAENSALKAHNTARKTGFPALADDSGLAIDVLGGAPGIYSARWAPDKDFSVAFERIKKELAAKNIHDANGVAAYFVCVLCLAFPDGKQEIFEGRIDGTLTFPPRGEKGFGYDPIFIPEGKTLTFAEMEAAEKHKVSHRACAFSKFVQYLESKK